MTLRSWFWLSVALAALLLSSLSMPPRAAAQDPPRFDALVFSKTTGFRHTEAIDAGKVAIRRLAAEHGMVAMEGLARCSAQRALMPGHRVAMQSCLEHVDEAIDSHSPADCTTILAALAVRLH